MANLTVIALNRFSNPSSKQVRAAASSLGRSRYYTGKPCPKGHVGDRTVSNGRCCLCAEDYKRRPGNVARELERLRKTRAADLENSRARDRAVYARDAEKIRARRNAWGRRKRAERGFKVKRLTGEQRKIANSMRCAVWRALKSRKARQGWRDLVGYDLPELMAHLERQFTKGMSWENFGEWHVDHIVPIAHFDFRSVDDSGFKYCFALANLRPMWADDNKEKAYVRTLLL